MPEPDLIPPEQAVTLDGLFRHRVQRSAERPAYIAYDRAAEAWVTHSWADTADQVARWQAALVEEGLRPGDRVALSLRNSTEWVLFEQAALGLGLVVVPLYTDDRPDNVAFILEDAAVKLLLLQDAGRWHRLAEALVPLEGLQRIVVLGDGDPAEEAAERRLCYTARWLPEGGHVLRGRDGDPTELGDALATIVYTSGTTGRPKGVMLSHRNILSNVAAANRLHDFHGGDLFLSFLPLSHMLERTAGYYMPMMAGAPVAYARSIPLLSEDLATLRPTVLIAVPRIFERIHGRIRHGLEQGSALRRALFHAAVASGWHRFEREQGRRGWGPGLLMALLLEPLLRRLVGEKVQAKLGGRLRLVVSGGAALSPEIARLFIGLGLDLVQGYGLTECAPVVSCNSPRNNLPASVGPPLPGVEVKVGEGDELLVRGANVMQGYWNNHAATAQVIDGDGWYHTGDQARIDEGGRITLTGRLKDILVLSNGEKVPPGDMELAIGLDPLFEQVMVVGEGRPYLVALAVLNGDLWPGLAQRLGLDPLNAASLEDRRLHHELIARVGRLCHDFPSYAKVRRLHLTLEPWSVDDGLITPTLKVKRNVVLERFAEHVEAMYAGGPAA